MLKKILIASALVVLAVAGGVYGYYQAMVKGLIRYNEYDIRTEGQLQVGDLAPDLELARVDGSGRTLLSELYRERPVVLAFGSYT